MLADGGVGSYAARMDRDWEPKAEETAAHEAYEDALAELEAARLDGDTAAIKRLERNVEDAKKRWRKTSRSLRARGDKGRREPH